MVVQIRTVDMADTYVQKFVRLCLKVDRLAVVTVRDNNLFIVRTAKHLEISKALEETALTLYIKNIEVIEKVREPYVYLLDSIEPANDSASEHCSL